MKKPSFVVIMAGGIGERFWPLSVPNRPKQLLPFGTEGKLLIKDAVDRGLALTNRESVWIATTKELRNAFEGLGILPPAQIVCEPCRRNTAGCLTYVVAQYLARHGESALDTVMAVLTADHRIEPIDEFVRTAQALIQHVADNSVLGIIGITPNRAETGYGYIETGRVEGLTSKDDVEILPVIRFHEKPNIEKAQEYVQSGNFYWNSGMFFWRLDTFLSELKIASPEHYQTVFTLAELIHKGDDQQVLNVFSQLQDISIDYALMEKAQRIVMAKASFNWDDLGSWTALDRVLSADSNHNIVQGNAITLHTQNTIIYNGSSRPQIIATLGIQNLVIAVTDDVILVMNKERDQEVKQLLKLYNKKEGSDKQI